jgi:polyisoprenoid-binding protein YceI
MTMLNQRVLRVVAWIFVAMLVVGVVAVLAVRQIVLGGTPTIHHSLTPLPLVACVATPSSVDQQAFVIDQRASSASYQAHFLVEGNAVPGTVTGITGDVSGGILVSTVSSPTIEALQVVVDLRTLDSGAPQRDDHVRNDTFQVDTYPLATFSAQDATVLSGRYTEGQTVSFQLPGNLTMHGVTRPVTFAMQGTLSRGTISGSGTTSIHIADWEMQQPEITSVLTVTIQPDITLAIRFVAHRGTCAG